MKDQTTNSAPAVEEIVVSAHRPKIPHLNTGGLKSAMGHAALGSLTGGVVGVAGPILGWLASEAIDGTRRGDLTPEMAARVHDHQQVKTEKALEGGRLHAVFNMAGGAAKEMAIHRAVGMIPIVGAYAGSPLGEIIDEEKFKSAHKDLIRDMAGKSIPGYEYQKTSIDGKQVEIYVDASSNARYPGATPIVYRPSGGKPKDMAENLRDKAIEDVQADVGTKTFAEDAGALEAKAKTEKMTPEQEADMYRNDEKTRHMQGVAAYEQEIYEAIKPPHIIPYATVAQAPAQNVTTQDLKM